MQRRRFLKNAGLASIGAPLLATRARGNEFPIGLELITVLALLANDFRGTLEAVADIGYREVETLGSLGHLPDQVHTILAGCHLTTPAQHLVPDDLFNVYQSWDRGALTMAEALTQLREGYALQRIDEIIEQGISRARLLRQQYLVWPVLFEEHVASRRALEKLTAAFNVAGQMCCQNSLTFAFHNGSRAFQRIGPDLAYDVILQETDPQTVKMEWDTYYAAKASVDVREYFGRYPGRFKLLHLKDIDDRGEITDLGRGKIDFPPLVRAARQVGVTHFFVEHDRARDPLLTAQSSFKYVRGL